MGQIQDGCQNGPQMKSEAYVTLNEKIKDGYQAPPPPTKNNKMNPISLSKKLKIINHRW